MILNSSFISEVILGIALVFSAHVFLPYFVKRFVAMAAKANQKESSQKHFQTVGHLLLNTGRTVIYMIVVIIVLDLLGLNVMPLLAGAGIIGLSVGFGAQALVRDFISGLFIIIENQYAVGDEVKIGDIKGIVKSVGVRTTVIKNEAGDMVYIANGNAAGKDIVNFSSGNAVS